MSLKKYSHDEIADFSMIETAYLVLKDEKKAINFREIFDRLAELKGYSKSQKKEAIAQFYTDLNTDGRFMAMGSNLWGLKQWYPFEQIDEEIAAAPKKKKAKKKKKKKDALEDDFEEDFDEEIVDELDLELTDEDFDELSDDDEDDDDDDDDEDDIDPSKNLDDSRVKDDSYDGDFRSDKLDEEDREVVDKDIEYTGEEDEDKRTDKNYN